MINWRQTVLSQYDHSQILISLLESINEWISPDNNFENFYNLIWNIDTAEEYGLDVWGRIVGVSRILSVTEIVGSFFGFGEGGDRTGFNQAPFQVGEAMSVTTNFTLTDETYRRLIFAKAALNLTNSSIPAINQILLNLFPNRGNAYVTDGNNGPTGIWFGFGEAGDRTGFNQGPFSDFIPAHPDNMSLIYVFDFVLEPFEIAMVKSGVLPKPVGVKANWQYFI